MYIIICVHPWYPILVGQRYPEAEPTEAICDSLRRWDHVARCDLEAASWHDEHDDWLKVTWRARKMGWSRLGETWWKMENGRTLNLEDFIVVCGKNIFKLCNIRKHPNHEKSVVRIDFFWCHRGRGNETGKMGPMGQSHGGNVSNVSNATESPWPEAIMGIMGSRVGWVLQIQILQDYFPEIFATDFKTRNALPFVHYNGCTMAAIPKIGDEASAIFTGPWFLRSPLCWARDPCLVCLVGLDSLDSLDINTACVDILHIYTL